MKLRMTWLAVLGMSLILCVTSCKQEMKPFSFSYSVESVNNFKVMLSFDSDKHYKVERYNYFMDNFAHKKDPKILEGELTDEEYETLAHWIDKSDLFSMEDSYGFEQSASDSMGDIVYQISLVSGGKEKYISIRSQEGQRFSNAFIQLVRKITEFNDGKLK